MNRFQGCILDHPNSLLVFHVRVRVVEGLVKDELVLENARFTIVELAVTVLVRHDQHQGALEVEQDEIGDQVREAWLHLLRARLVLLVGLERAHLPLTLNLLLLLGHELYLTLVEKPNTRLLKDADLVDCVPIEGLLLEHLQQVIEVLLRLEFVLVELVPEVFPLAPCHRARG